jgi:pilus assembly protein CpaB
MNVSDETDVTAGGAVSRKLLLISTGFGLLGAALLFLYLHRFEEQMSGGSRVELLTVLQPIERGALIKDEMLGVFEVPLAYVEQRAVRAAEKSKIVGIRAAHAIDVQSTLLWTDLSLSNESRDLSSLVQPGKRAVSVRATEAGSDPAGNGLLRPGHYVDVFATFRESSTTQSEPVSVVLLQRVLVLAVGSETEAKGFSESKTNGSFQRETERQLTLSLKLEEAQLLALARARGSISVALRSADDNKIIEAVPDMPGNVLMDKSRRQVVQRRPTSAPPADGPLRLMERGT